MKVNINGVEYAPIKTVEGEGLLAALECRFDSDAGDNITIRDYLHAQLQTLWKEGESFSGKRPFGNSGWAWDLYLPLVMGGFVKGVIYYDEDGEYDCFEVEDKVAAKKYILQLIKAIFYT
jgi:hypothetical protein